MTYAELVAALTAAIDNPPTDGTAGEGDEQQAAPLLEKLVRAKARLDGAVAGVGLVSTKTSSLHDQYVAELAA